MKKKENVEVMLIAETNWLESIALAQDSAAAYLLDLADSKKIEIAVPEYSIYEADGSLNRKLIKRAEKIDDALSLLGQIAQTTHYADLCEKGREILKELKKLTLDDRTEIKRVLDEIKSMVRIIPYTSDASTRAEIMFESSSPPFKVGDCRIYASILAFLELIKEEYDSIIFYTADKEDFDHSKIHEDLRNLGVEFMFDSGTCVERVER
ncbi:hypothetical protein ES705_10295 [subsurface metagenome]